MQKDLYTPRLGSFQNESVRTCRTKSFQTIVTWQVISARIAFSTSASSALVWKSLQSLLTYFTLFLLRSVNTIQHLSGIHMLRVSEAQTEGCIVSRGRLSSWTYSTFLARWLSWRVRVGSTCRNQW